MKNMQPRITTFPDIEVLVDNQILLDQVNEIKGRIRVTLAKHCTTAMCQYRSASLRQKR